MADFPLDRLRWIVNGRDVTCENCHTAMYRPASDVDMCPTCRVAAGEDVLSIQNDLQSQAASMRGAA